MRRALCSQPIRPPWPARAPGRLASKQAGRVGQQDPAANPPGKQFPSHCNHLGFPPGLAGQILLAKGSECFASKCARPVCQPDRPGALRASRPGRFAANRPAAPRKICRKIFCRPLPTIPEDRQRSPARANDSQARATIDNARQRSTVENQRISNARRRSSGLGQRSTTPDNDRP